MLRCSAVFPYVLITLHVIFLCYQRFAGLSYVIIMIYFCLLRRLAGSQYCGGIRGVCIDDFPNILLQLR